MKIIELLNKIANGEEVPKKIKWEDTIFAYSDYDKDYLEFPFSEEEYQGLFDMKDSILTQYLNDEVEILEEEPRDIEICGSWFTKSEYDKLAQSEEEKKIPEKLNIERDTPTSNYYIRNEQGTKCALTKHSKMIAETLNQVIDYLKSKGE